MKPKWIELLNTFIDTFFVLVLFFITLLVTIAINDQSFTEHFSGYTLSLPILCLVVAAIGGYVVFLLRTSIREQREFIERHFSKEKSQDEEL